MTLERLRERFPDATAETWHQHANGAGWVENTATVDATSFVGEDAIIGGLARVTKSEIRGGEIRGGEIRGGVIRGGEIRGGEIRGGEIRGGEIRGGVIWGGVIWGGVIRGGVIRGGEIRGGVIWGGVIWGGVIRGGVIWGGEIWGGEWKRSPLFIQGTRHVVNISQPGVLAIGCLSHPVDWWRANRLEVGKREGYTPQEIEEYGLYIELAAAWLAIHCPDGVEPTAGPGLGRSSN